MTRLEVACRLVTAGYRPDLLREPDTFWRHPKQKCTVQVHYGGHVTIWYISHPKHWCYTSVNGEYTDK